MNETDFEYLIANGLTETTEEDQQCCDELMSLAVPFTAHWENLDDEVKCFQWDDQWERYIKHCAELIDYEGRDKWLPWNLYRSLGLNWLDGYNFTQRIGNCCGHAHKNAGKASCLTNAERTGKSPREIALCIAYGIARGNGQMRMGSGLNLNPMAKWAATVGNFWTADFGRYDGGRNANQWRRGDSPPNRNALKTQSVVIYLPSASFDHCYAVCAAGFGINMGTSTFPTASAPNGDGLSAPSAWRSGGHAMAFISAYTGRSGRRYVYLENSHGARYAADGLHPSNQHGCWIDEAAFGRMANNAFRFGRWYVNLMDIASYVYGTQIGSPSTSISTSVVGKSCVATDGEWLYDGQVAAEIRGEVASGFDVAEKQALIDRKITSSNVSVEAVRCSIDNRESTATDYGSRTAEDADRTAADYQISVIG